jgi:phage shock protein A
MFNVLKTLIAGANARSEDNIQNYFAVDLLDQKIREADQDLERAKSTLASLIIRKRNEKRALDGIKGRIADLEERTLKAIEAQNDDLATQGAQAIAELQNEADIRSQTVNSLTSKTDRMQLSIEKMHRRIVSLKQGMIEARSIDAECRAQKSMNRTIGKSTNIREAEKLIDRIKGRDDPFEENEVLEEIDAGLNHTNTKDALAEAGFGGKTKTSAEDVLARLAAKQNPKTKA